MTKKHDIIWLDTVESTNEYVKMHISALDNLSVVAAYSQTMGKGQGEHRWLSEPGMNLTFSILLTEEALSHILPKEQFIISALTALSLIEFLHEYGIKAKIKYPNDIYVGEKKICGTLIENSLKSNRFSWSIIGIGLNVNQVEFDTSLPNPTSMRLYLHGCDCMDLHSLLESFMQIFISSFISYKKNGDLEDLRNKYMSRLFNPSLLK